MKNQTNEIYIPTGDSVVFLAGEEVAEVAVVVGLGLGCPVACG